MHWATFGALCEFLPLADNRVTLAGESDRHGLPVANFSYSLCDNDRALVKAASAMMNDIHEGAGADEAITIERYAHLVGGCRMATAPTEGVVDADLRTFAVPNLYITDGSVLPTQGSANPALTIMALAARAAEHLGSANRGVGTMTAGVRHVVVVTGASAGVGRATVRAFAERGFDVALLARGHEGLARAAAEVRELGREALPITVDVSRFEEVDAAAAQVERELGPIDIWVNDAMTTVFAPRPRSSLRTSAERWRSRFSGRSGEPRPRLSRMKP